METSCDVLDAIARAYGTDEKPASDYRIAQLLDSTPSRISSIRHGRLFLSKALALKAADLLGIDPGSLVTLAAAERETNKKLKASLLKLARAGLAAVLVLGISVPYPAAATGVLCILCKIRDRARKTVVGGCGQARAGSLPSGTPGTVGRLNAPGGAPCLSPC